MSFTSVSLSAFKSSDQLGSYIIVHGSVVVNDESIKLKISKLSTPDFKATTLMLNLLIGSETLQSELTVKSFFFKEQLDLDQDYDQIELISNQDHHLVVDVEAGEEVSNNFVIEGDLRQNIFAAEDKLNKMGSLTIMHKKGSKLKDNK